MPVEVEIPDVGTVEFPDSMSQQQIADAIKTHILPAKPDSETVTPSLSVRTPLPSPGSGDTSGSKLPPSSFDFAREQFEQGARRREASMLTPEQTRRLDEGSIAENLMTAPPGLEVQRVTPQQVSERFPTMTEGNAKILAGLMQTGADVWNFAASPMGLAALPVALQAGASGVVGAAGKGAVATFAIDAVRHMPELVREFEEAIASKDPEAIARTASMLTVNTAVAIGAGRGAVQSVKGIPIQEAGSVVAKTKAAKADATDAAMDKLVRDLDKGPIIKPEELKSTSETAKASGAEKTGQALEQTTKVEVTPPEIKPDLATPESQTVGISVKALPKRFIEDVKSEITKWFKIGGHFPEEVKAILNRMEGEIAAGQFMARKNTQSFLRSLKDAYGLTEAEMIGGGSRRIPAAEVQLMNDYLKGQSLPSQVKPQMLPVLDTMRSEITGMSARIIKEIQSELNKLPPDSPRVGPMTDLIETIRNNADVYLNRSYKFVDSRKPAPSWYADLPDATRLAAEDYLIQNMPEGMTRAEAQSSLLRWLSDLKDKPVPGQGSKVGAKDLSAFLKRKVIPKELREVLGEYNNPLVNYARSMEKMVRWVANNRFLNDVKQKGMGKFLFEEGADPPGFNARIAAEGTESMSPLSGLRTSQPIADAFRDIGKGRDHGLIVRTYLTANAMTKASATIQSIMTQARNLGSRPFMAGMAGHWNLGKLGKSVKSIAQDFAGSDASWKPYLKELYELGVIGDTARSSELKAVIKDAALQDVAPEQLYSWSLAHAIKKIGYDIPGDIYRLSDELGNIFGFENEKIIQRKINPTWTDAQVKSEAAKITRELYPTYSEAPKAVKEFRKVAVVGPFVNFPFQVWRTMWNGFAQSISELRSSNPVAREVGKKRLASQVGTLAATYGLMEVGKQILGISNQEEDDFRRFQPEWARNSKWLFIGKEEGELTAVNLSYLDPYSYATDILPAVMTGIRTGEDPFDIFANVTMEILGPWVSEQMLFNAIIEARNGKTDFGRQIFNPTDSGLEKTSKRMSHVVNSLFPGTLQRAHRRLIPAIKGEQPTYGRKLEVGQEVARELTGIAVEGFNFKTALAFKASDFVKAENSSEDVFRSTLSRTKTTTDSDMAEAYREANQRRLMLWRELRGDYMAALRSGVSRREADRMLNNRGVTQATTDAIARGRYEPFSITPTMEKRAAERNRKIPFGELRSIERDFRGMSLDE